MAKTSTKNKPAARKTAKSGKKTRSGKGRKTRSKKPMSILSTVLIALSIIIALALCISIPYINNRVKTEKGAAIPSGNYLYGIDISKYQKRIVWDSLMVLTDRNGNTVSSKMAAMDMKPVSFVFIKATEGLSHRDIHFQKHWKDAGESNIRRGAYHFFRSSKDPHKQAENFISCVGELRYRDLPPVLDVETIHKGCTDKELNTKIKAFLGDIERHYGRKPIIYVSEGFLNNHLSADIKRNYPVWVAHYDVSSPQMSDWTFWQFTDSGLVYGIEGPVDMDVCRVEFLKK